MVDGVAGLVLDVAGERGHNFSARQAKRPAALLRGDVDRVGVAPILAKQGRCAFGARVSMQRCGMAESEALGAAGSYREGLLEVFVAFDAFGDDQRAGAFVVGEDAVLCSIFEISQMCLE
jgi:hypothetical protein